MDNFMFAVLLFLAIIFVSRAINQKANNKLDADKKAELVDLFSKNGLYTFGVLILIIAFYFGNLKFQWVDFAIATSIYVIALLLFLLSNRYIAYKKLKNHNFPDDYIKMYMISSTIRFLGLIIFFYLLDFY